MNATITDPMPDALDNLCDEIRELVEKYYTENPDDTDNPVDLGDLDNDGSVTEVIDSAVPIYTTDIRAAWYFNESSFLDAYERAGFGHNPHENNGMMAIYCYLQEEVYSWYDQVKDEILENWQETNNVE